MRALVGLAVAALSLYGPLSQAQNFSYTDPHGFKIYSSGVEASSVNTGFLDLVSDYVTGIDAHAAPQSCLDDVYYFDLTTPFGQSVQQMTQTYWNTLYVRVVRFDFIRKQDGRCWLTVFRFG